MPTPTPARLGHCEGQEHVDLWITNVRLAPPSQTHSGEEEDSYDGTWLVKCSGGVVTGVSRIAEPGHSISAADDVQILDAGGGIMLPSDFKEAMAVTSKVKEGFPASLDDLYQRGARLIEESLENGVTSMRAHVEVDSIVGFSCLNVALDLKSQYKDICDVQIAVFAQEALFENASATEPGENYTILCQAMRREGVSVVGSAPYTEPTMEQARKNIQLIFDAAMGSQGLLLNLPRHVDFHLDYNLDPAMEPLIHEVIAQARIYYSLCGLDRSSQDSKGVNEAESVHPKPSRGNASQSHARNEYPDGPCITIGHATRLQLLSASEWHDLRKAIGELPISLVGLPQSDMYIQGRAHQGNPLGPPRSTLRVPLIEQAFGIKVAMAVNNVDNAFTPQGTLDPLSSLVTFGVAIFQAVTPREIRTLIEAVTLTSKRAIGFDIEESVSLVNPAASGEREGKHEAKDQGYRQSSRRALIHADLFPTRGDPADFVVLHDNGTLRAAALHPSFDRTTIKNGRVVARRRKWRWISGRKTN